MTPQEHIETAMQKPRLTLEAFRAESTQGEDADWARLLQNNTGGGSRPDYVDPSLEEVMEQPWTTPLDTQLGAQPMETFGADFAQAGVEDSMMGTILNQSHKRAAEDVLDHGRANTPFMYASEEPTFSFQLSWTPDEQKKYELIVRSLDFVERETRLATIHEPSEGTSNWIFESTAGSEHKFEKWLRSDSGVFLILGKAGSGKSTLLKHIVHHKECEALLTIWTTIDGFKHDLIIATCCFWRAGSDMQRKKEGLYRSLLTQILEQRQELTPIVLPKHWTRQYHRCVQAERKLWDVAELKRALFRAVEHNSLLRFCFFIDGLDEYSDSYALRELVQDLEELSELTNVKICITSRPSAIRNQYFEKQPRLSLEALTKPDILRYVKLKLESHGRFQQLRLKNSERAEKTISKIQHRSEGVFLWTYLVIERLITDLEYMGTLIELERAVELLPPGMEELLDDIISRIEPDDRIYAVRLLLLLLQPNGTLEVGKAYCLVEEHQNSCPVLKTDATAFAHCEVDLSEYSIMAEVRVKRWCQDLIEIRACALKSFYTTTERAVQLAVGGAKSVHFAHRTVYDYVEKHHQVLVQRWGSHFDVRRARCRVSLLWLRNCLQAESNGDQASMPWTDLTFGSVRDVLENAADLDMALEEGDQTSSAVLHALNRMRMLPRRPSMAV